ncbi:MAG: MFS transporter [Candidatus Hydrogenedentota bacterium]|nr:MAG: MFS transporter [Candidatus Hydrogenedentota bacterium]
MRAFHMSWFAFFLCFFAWFGMAPLMAVIRDEFSLTKEQIGNTIIASVLMTIVARIFVGWCCDRFGPRLTYTCLLVVCSIPVMGVGLAHSYETLLLFRLAIGGIGASFVITQYHTSIMFAPNVVGTANATTAGWGNMGSGATQIIMPLIFAGLLAIGFSEAGAWRAGMVVAGFICLLTGLAYYRFTQDTPEGNFRELRKQGLLPKKEAVKGSFKEACSDSRVWSLFLVYGACFGVELTINNIAVMYFMDDFGLSLMAAGAVAACFGLMNIFARTLGGVFADRLGKRWGLRGRVGLLASVLALEGVTLMLFSQASMLWFAVVTMIIFSLFVKMAQGATFSIVPFINKRALGSVAGIVGAGGNFGAVCAGFLFKTEALSWSTALLIMGAVVLVCAAITTQLRFSEADETQAREDLQRLETLRPATEGVS